MTPVVKIIPSVTIKALREVLSYLERSKLEIEVTSDDLSDLVLYANQMKQQGGSEVSDEEAANMAERLQKAIEISSDNQQKALSWIKSILEVE